MSQWFRREAAALARVKHPGVPKVLDVGDTDGRAYLVMELIEGESLAARIQRAPLPLPEAIELGKELVDIIGAVHARGLVHRDIKPRNILLEPQGRLRLVDFGLVTQLRPILGVASEPTSRSYVAPEQARNPQLADTRADFYSLGRVLEHALSSEEREREPVAVLLSHLCAEDPATRYASAERVKLALDDVAHGRVPARPKGPPGSTQGEPLPLVGQEEQRRRIRRFEQRMLSGSGGFALVQGPPGSGKSRVLADVATTAEPRVLALTVRAQSTPPLQAVRGLLDAFLDHPTTGPDDRHEDRLEQLRRSVPAPAMAMLGRLSERLRATLAASTVAPDREHEAFPEATADLLLTLARHRGGLLICIDDIDQLDPLSREVLVRTALGATSAPLLLVGAARNESSPVLTRFENALGRDKLARIELQPLDERAAGELLCHFLGESRLDPDMVERITGLADGTPLSVLEIAGALIDGGALWPQWGAWRFDAPRMRQIPLPRGTNALLRQRLAQLSAPALLVLETLSLVAPLFDPHKIAQMLNIGIEDVQLALVEARDAALIELLDGRPAFVHATVRETLFERLSPEARRELHRKAAAAWDDGHFSDLEALYAVAEHYDRGGVEHCPREAFAAAQRAAFRAAAQLDHEGALRFFAIAERCCEGGAIDASAAFYRSMAESQISVGDHEGSLRSLERALRLCHGMDRVELLARQAWVCALQPDAARAWQLLDQAFSELGDSMPTESPVKLASALLDTLQSALQRAGTRHPESARRQELLCQLHHQNARLGIEYNKPLRVLMSARALHSLAQRMAPLPSIARTRAIEGVLMTALGRRRAGAAALAEATAMAARLDNPSTVADICQAEFVAKVFSSELSRALELASKCLDIYGHWLNVTDFALVAVSAREIETMRGRPLEALAWLDRAERRVRRHRLVPAAHPHMLVPARLAELTVLGREPDEGCSSPGDAASEPIRGIFRIGRWGPRATTAYHDADFRALESLIAEYEAEGQSPARAHLAISEYYLVVAYARGDQCLRASGSKAAEAFEHFVKALSDLRKAARLRLLKAHVKAMEGLQAILSGDHQRARERLAQAKELGEQETAPWVLFSVARYDAHLLRRENRMESALHRAKVAAMLAEEYGAQSRLRLIREEFSLLEARDEVLEAGLVQDARGIARRQLHSLLRITETAPDLRTQSRLVLCELLVAVGAGRGLLAFELPGATPHFVALTAQGHEWQSTDPRCQAILHQLQHDGIDSFEDDPRLLATPLFLVDSRIGSLVVERDAEDAPFTRAEVDQLMMLAAQLPLALELARKLQEREQVEVRRRQDLRMESMRELAGATANDLNTTLTAMLAGLEDLDEENASGPGARQSAARRQRESLALIRDGLRRASDLTRQLLTFSGRQLLDIRTIDVRETVSDIVPLIQRILGNDFELRLRIPGAAKLPLRTDRGHLEQAIVNMAINARDAMPAGGTIDIVVTQVDIGEDALQHGASRTGPHIVIELRDRGFGMSSELCGRVFEPFFTTKPKGSGTGLGLASVYGFVKQCEGFIRATSEPGEGSSFTLHLPCSEDPPVQPAPRRDSDRLRNEVVASGVILLVEEDRVLRNSITSILQRVGYWVMTAGDLLEAVEIVRAGGPVDLVILNAALETPEIDLDQELEAAGLQIPLLYVGAPAADEPHPQVPGEWVDFIPTPFDHHDLLEKVRMLLGH